MNLIEIIMHVQDLTVQETRAALADMGVSRELRHAIIECKHSDGSFQVLEAGGKIQARVLLEMTPKL